MKEIELYDIITLENNKEYTVLRLLELDENTYYLLSEIDDDENPNLEELRIVEIVNNTLQDITNQTKLEELKELFISSLDAEI